MVCRTIAAMVACCCLCVDSDRLIAQTPASTDLSALLNQQVFEEVDDKTFDRSKNDLLSALRRPPSDVAPDDWAYLRTEAVAESLEQSSPELREWLDNILQKLNQNYSPYEQTELLELRRLVRRHLRMIDHRERRNQLQQEFQRRQSLSQQSLATLQSHGDQEAHQELSEHIRWMQENGMAKDFVHSAKLTFSYPNFDARLPASFVSSVSATALPTQTETINRTSDGIQTVGSGVFTSRAHLRPIAAADHGDFHLDFSGEFRLTATNTIRRVCFHSNATTRASATGIIGVDQSGYLSYGGLRVCTQTQLCNGKSSVNRRVGKKLIGRLVDRVVAKKSPEVEQSLSRELQERVEDELSTQLIEMVDKANATVTDRVRSPANRLDMVPREFSVRTSNDLVHVRMTEDTQCGLAAPRPFRGDELDSGYAAFHTSLLEDLINILYVRNKQPSELNGDLVQRLNTSLPVQLFSDVNLPEIRFSMVLDLPRPFQLNFENGKVYLTIKAKNFSLDQKNYPGRDLTIAYRVSAEAGNKIRFELQGSPEIGIPADEAPSVTQQLRNAVNQELLAGLRPEFVLNLEDLISGDTESGDAETDGPDASDAKGGDDQSLPIDVESIAARAGWLILSLQPSAKGGISLVQN